MDIKNEKTQKYALANETCKNKKGCQIISAPPRGYKEPDDPKDIVKFNLL